MADGPSLQPNYVIKIGRLFYPFRGRGFIYQNIGSQTGVEQATTETKVELKVRISELVRSGKVFVLRARTANGKFHRIYCSVDKISEAGGITGKTVGGAIVTSVGGTVRRYIK